MIFDRFKKKKEDAPLPETFESPAQLPDDLERFRMRPPETRLPEIKPPEAMPELRNDYPVPELQPTKSAEDLVAERARSDKIELILQKLETIDARLRLMEERTKKY